MNDSTPLPLLPVVLGPTASGKTALALAIAEKLGGSKKSAEIISCDSVAVYREFEIGTAKPTREERARVPHHMIDVVSPGEVFTAGDYVRQARATLAEITARGSVPIVAGGTGLYLRALLDGLFPGPPRSEELRNRLRARAEERGAAYLHKILARLDKVAAGNIHANDVPKLIRAIEVCLTARSPISELHQHGRDPLTGYRIVRIGLDPERAQLYVRINARCEKMFTDGLIEETRALWAAHPEFHSTPERERQSPFFALGYRQAMQHIRGELTREAALAATQQAHRNYAKRQMTWFRREPEVHWLSGFGDEVAVQKQAIHLLTAAAT